MPTPLLLSVPREISLKEGTVNLSTLDGSIALKRDPAASLWLIGKRAQNALKQFAGVEWSIAGGDLPAGLIISVDNNSVKAEAHHLSIDIQRHRIIGGIDAAAFYGVCTQSEQLQM